MVYEWASGARFPAEAQAIGDRCELLRKRHGGTVAPEHVLEDAEKKSSPLHSCFEWNDERAAHEYRLTQARLVLRSLVVVVDERVPEPVRAFVSVRTVDEDDAPSRRYTAIADALEDSVMREQLLESARREIKSWRSKYQRLDELAAIFSVVDEQLEIQHS
jgi:hypothetical protein